MKGKYDIYMLNIIREREMKDKGVDEFLRGFVKKNMDAVVMGFLLLCSVVIRFHFMKHGTSSDLVGYFIPWVEQYRNSIPLAFKEGVGDYYIPYNVLLAIISLIPVPVNYSVGAISCLFDYLTSFYVYKILTENFYQYVSKRAAKAISIIYLFIPTFLFDGAAWKQCDAIYSFFVLVLIKCILDDRIKTAFIMLGIAFSFKLQAIFILPFLIILYFINKKIKIVYFLYPVVVYFIAGLPAVFFGRPIKDVYTIYLAQTDEYHQMTLHYPNLYMIAMTDYEKMHIYAKLMTIAILALALWYICKRVKTISGRSMIALAIWCVWTCCMFLPSMHQRYDYIVAVLLVVCIPIIINEKPLVAIVSATLYYIGSIVTYSYSLFGDEYNPIFVMCCNVIAYALFCYILWKRISKEETNENTTDSNE